MPLYLKQEKAPQLLQLKKCFDNKYIVAVRKSHSHIAIVVTPPSLKSFANQKNLSNHRVVIRKNPLQITSDHFRMTTL
jgi:Holliday junction resolvase